MHITELFLVNFCSLTNDRLPEKNQWTGSKLGGKKKKVSACFDDCLRNQDRYIYFQYMTSRSSVFTQNLIALSN